MANRYWVGGNGTWDAADTTNWSASSGGAGGASVPGASDAVLFDANSGGGTCTINTNPTITTLNTTGYTGTLDASTNNAAITCTTFTGGSGATFWLGTGTLTLTGGTNASSVVLKGNATISIASGTYTISGIISESGGVYSLSKADAGQVTLSGNNTFTGGVTIKAGTVSCTNAGSVNAFGTGTITIGDTSGSANATLNPYKNGTFTNAISVVSGSSGTKSINVASGGAIPTLSGDMTLSDNVTVGAAGTSSLIMSGNISGSGNITISTGTSNGVTLSGEITATGNVVCNTSGTATITISKATGNGVNPTGTITNSGGGTGPTTISGVIGSNVTGVIQNSTTSQLTLRGNNASYANGVTVQKGTLQLQTSVNAAGTGTITLGGTTSNAVILKGSGLNFANAISLVSSATHSGTMTIQPSATSCIFSGNITGSHDLILDGSSTFTMTLQTGNVNNAGTITNSNAGSGAITLAGTIGANVTGISQNSSTSALTISGSTTANYPNLTVSLGTCNLTQNNTFQTVTIDGNATLNITAAKTITLTSLASTGTAGNLAVLKSATAAAHTLTTASPQISTDYLSLTYSQPTQTNTWYAGANSTDNGNNGNWIFAAPTSSRGRIIGGGIGHVLGV